MSKTVNNADQINAVITTNGDATASVDFTPTQDTHVVNKAYVDNVIPNVANPNLIINGGFDVWQRGTSFSAAGYTADRWMVNNANVTVSRGTSRPSGDFAYCSVVQASGGANAHIRTSIELGRAGSSTPIAGGEEYTISFYARSTTDTGNTSIMLNWRDTVGSSSNSGTELALTPVGTLSASWQKYEYTHLITTANINPTNISIELYIEGSLANADIYVTGVKLEQGSVATPWFYEDYGTTLAKCQRYFERHQRRVDENESYWTGQCTSTTVARVIIPCYVKKRALPTVDVNSSGFRVTDASGTNLTVTSAVGIAGRVNAVVIEATVASGLVAGNATQLVLASESANYIDIDAEL